MTYNKADTPYYKAAQRIQKQCRDIMEKAKADFDGLAVAPETGVLDVDLNPEIFHYNLVLIPGPEEEEAARREAEAQAAAEAEALAREQRKAQQLPPEVMPRRTTRSMIVQGEAEDEAEQLDHSPGFRRPPKKKAKHANAGYLPKRMPKGWVYLTESEDTEAETPPPSTEVLLGHMPDGEISTRTRRRVTLHGVPNPPVLATAPTTQQEGTAKDETTTRKRQRTVSEVSVNNVHLVIKREEVITAQDVKRSRVTGELPDLPVGAVVWAKVIGFPAHPATIYDPDDPEVSAEINGKRATPEQLLVQFFEVEQKDMWGWVYRKDVTPLGNVDVDRHKLDQVKKGKKVKRIAEVRKGYECACKLLRLDPNRVLAQPKEKPITIIASSVTEAVGYLQESRSASTQASGPTTVTRPIATARTRSRTMSGSASEAAE
ncbi:hypothetical protein BC936DRAFT_139500, partial [Jimgerdemannia flammicorona]